MKVNVDIAVDWISCCHLLYKRIDHQNIQNTILKSAVVVRHIVTINKQHFLHLD